MALNKKYLQWNIIRKCRIYTVNAACTCRWYQINLASSQQGDPEPDRGRCGGPFQFRKKSKAVSLECWCLPMNSHLRSGNYVFRARRLGDSVIFCSILWTSTTYSATCEDVRRNFLRVDDAMKIPWSRWLLWWQMSQRGADGTTESGRTNFFHSFFYPAVFKPTVVTLSTQDAAANFSTFYQSFYFFY